MPKRRIRNNRKLRLRAKRWRESKEAQAARVGLQRLYPTVREERELAEMKRRYGL